MGGARFERRAKLVKKVDFNRVFEQPQKSGDRYFTVLARPNTLDFPRLGMAISRKAAKSAVVRNRIKRVVRESFRRQQEQLGGVDFVVIGRAGLTTVDNAALLDSLQKHWARLVRRCVGS